jgi:hypothetical protein
MSQIAKTVARLHALSALLKPIGCTINESGGAREIPRWYHIKEGDKMIFESPDLGRIERKARNLRYAKNGRVPPEERYSSSAARIASGGEGGGIVHAKPTRKGRDPDTI